MKLRKSTSTAELLQPPRLSTHVQTPWGYRRRSLSQDDTASRSHKGFSRSLSGTGSPSSRASPVSSRGSEQDLEAVLRPQALAARAAASSAELICSQPSSTLPPSAVPRSEAGGEKFRSRLAVALQYFHFFRDLKPKVFNDLLQSANIEDFPAGRVLFKQGDLSGACYLVLSGSVGLYLEHQGMVVRNSKARHSSKQRMPQRRRSKSMFTTEPVSHAQVLAAENMEVQTAEGHCHHAEEMSLGTLSDTLSPGKLFGEVCFRSVEGKERRPVSAKCLEETCCVVIRKQVFTRAMKEEQKRCDEERLAFLETHLPGMKEALLSSEKSLPKGKAAIAFKQAVFCKGHVFLKQDETAEDITYILVKGSVEFLRSEKLTPPRSILASDGVRPGSAPEASRHAWNEEIGAGTVLPAGEVKQREITRRIGALARGGVFSSLAMLGEVEPFTVVAASAVEVLYIGSESKQRMPRVVAEMLREQVSRSTLFRLGNLRVNRAVDRKRSQVRTAPSFPLLQSLFASTPKDWSVMSKVSHAELEPLAVQAAETRRALSKTRQPRL